MLPVLISLPLNKILKPNQHTAAKFFYSKSQLIMTFISALLMFSGIMFSQQQSLSYKVVRNGDETGWLKLNKNISGNTSVISMASEVKVKLIFLFTIISNEYIECKENKLVHSYIFRKTNGTVKTDSHTRLNGNIYETENYSGKEKLKFIPAVLNVLDLYFRQPDGVELVYSASHQQNLQVTKKRPFVYELHLPDGNSNEYYYNTDGICSKVKINHSLYSAEFILTRP